MSYRILGRNIKNEYLALGTIFGAVALAFGATGGKKEEHHAPASGGTLREQIQKVKDAIPLGAGSSEEEQLVNSIKKYIEEEEAKAKH